MTEYIQVVTTMASREDAERMARALVEKRLAACAQVSGPLTSFFWWEEKIDRSEEYACVIKTRKDLFEEVEEAIRGLHPYQVPEILATPVVAGGREYLQWMAAELAA